MSEGNSFLHDALVRQCPACDDLLALAVLSNSYGHELGWACSECDLVVDVDLGPVLPGRSRAEWHLMLRYLCIFVAAAQGFDAPGRINHRQPGRTQSCRSVRKHRRR